jgi:long-chain acyl-CoA synthetase
MGESAGAVHEYPWERHYPPDVDWHAPIVPAPLWGLLDDSAARFPDRPCLHFLGRSWTYRQTRALVDRAACGLQALGVVKGTRVGLFLPNTPYSVIVFYAVLKAGGTVVNFNPLYAEQEVIHQIDDSGTETMVTLDLAILYDKLKPHLDAGRLKRLVICSMAAILPFPKNWLFPLVRRRDLAAIAWDDRHIPFARLTRGGSRPAPVAIDACDDVAVLQYTGGTTGVPKGAMLTHANLYANAVQCSLWFPHANPGQEKMLGVLPLFHVFAMTAVMNLSIRLGAEIVLLPRYDLNDVMRTIQERRITLFPAVPTIYTAINQHKDIKSFDLSSIRYCLSGGAALPLEVREIFERNTGCTLVEGYGLSESSPVAAGNPIYGGLLYANGKPGSIGLPLPGTVIEIVSLDEPRRVLPIGEKGEICLSGPQIMKGYWNKPQETALTLMDGRLHTGDVGIMDEDGYIFIVDRIKDMILCSGFNVYPRNVEEAIYQHPAVAECVVAGVDDSYRGQTVKAYIRLSDGQTLTREELVGFLKDKLSPIEMPKQVEFRGDLPKTMIGKLSRKALLDEERQRQRESGTPGNGRNGGGEGDARV